LTTFTHPCVRVRAQIDQPAARGLGTSKRSAAVSDRQFDCCLGRWFSSLGRWSLVFGRWFEVDVFADDARRLASRVRLGP
jgi:hypothetical protein